LITLRYGAALFDLDGTLIDSGQDLVASVRHAVESAFPGHEAPDADDVLVQVGRPLEVIARELGYAASDADVGRFVEAYRAYYADHFNDHTEAYPGVEELLGYLKTAGVKLAVVTTKHQTQADFALAGCGLSRYFDYVHGWQEGRQHKPHPEPVVTALARLDAEARDAIMVGDAELDIEAARAAGVDVCAVTYGFRPAWLLRSYHPDYLVAAAADIGPIVAPTT
jgi:pyrophosphatase PpaX